MSDPVSNSNTNNNMIGNCNCGGTVRGKKIRTSINTPLLSKMQNPTVEVQQSTILAQLPLTSASSSSCIVCIVVLTPTQRSPFEKYGIPQVLTSQNITTIEQMCTILDQIQSLSAQLQDVVNIGKALRVQHVDVNAIIADNIENCLDHSI